MYIILYPNDPRPLAEIVAPFIAKGYRLIGKVINGEPVLKLVKARKRR